MTASVPDVPSIPGPASFPTAGGKPYPINLPTAMKLGNARGLDIELASRRLQAAGAELQRAKVLWVPNLIFGTDYYRHDGQIQDIQGNVFGTSKQGFSIGGAPYMVFSFADAIFSPLAARQTTRARQAEVQAATNDTLLAVTQAYFNVQQARGELAGADRQQGMEIFPSVDSGQFQLRLRAADGTRIETTEQIANEALAIIKEVAGPENVAISVGYVGLIPASYPINTIYLWMRGPEEAVLHVGLKPRSGVSVEALKQRLREELPRRLRAWLEPKLRGEGLSADQASDQADALKFSFEPADIINEVMSFGSATPVEVTVSGAKLAESRAYAFKVYEQLAHVPSLRDLQFVQPLDYPALQVDVDRERAGLSGVTAAEVSRSVVSATSSSRFVVPIYWADPDSGIGYQVQVEIPPYQMDSAAALGMVPLKGKSGKPLLLRDLADIRPGTMPGEYDRYNMKRQVSLAVEIDLPNANGPLRPGMYAYASLSADLTDVLTVPRSAVATEGDVTRGYQTYCLQVEDGKVRRLPIELGPGDGERVEVLRKQVRAGGPWEQFNGKEQIVRGNLSRVCDGQAVRTKE
jgi:hypothetical protein